MSDIPSFPYRLLWEQRAIRSVASVADLTRQDAREFVILAGEIPCTPTFTSNLPYGEAPDGGRFRSEYGAAPLSGLLLQLRLYF